MENKFKKGDWVVPLSVPTIPRVGRPLLMELQYKVLNVVTCCGDDYLEFGIRSMTGISSCRRCRKVYNKMLMPAAYFRVSVLDGHLRDYTPSIHPN